MFKNWSLGFRCGLLFVAACGAACGEQSRSATAPAAVATEAGTEASAGPALNQDLAAIRRATARYHDLDKAIADGYVFPGPDACVSSPEGMMGIHVVNPTLARDISINLDQPEVLLYMPKPNGGYQLVGVEYFSPVLVRAPQGAPQPWFASGPWPSDWTIVNPAPTLLGRTFDGPMAGHEPGMPWHYDLHVWAWQPNPRGDFSHFNPRLSCQGHVSAQQ